MLPSHAHTIGNYFYLLRVSEVVACLKYENGRYNTMASAHLGKPIVENSTVGTDLIPVLPLVASIMYADLNQVNAFVAAAAWLTTDDFRWHEKPHSQLGIPETLSYGLVLQYPDFILPYCSVLCNYERNKLEKGVSAVILEKAKVCAIEQTKKSAPNSDKLRDFLAQHSLP